MTRKDYNMITAALVEERAWGPSPEKNLVIDRVSKTFAIIFAKDNPLFDAAKFLKACEYGS